MEGELSEAAVALLSRAAGVVIAEDRLAAVTRIVNELFELGAELNKIDLSQIEPEMRFDARWPEAGA